jgi:sec-independent protein translocase protein TatA
MFGIGGGELVFIIIIALMLFGADKVPDIARTVGKVMSQVKNATNDIKSEITKSANENDIDIRSFSNHFTNEVTDLKQSVNKMIDQGGAENPLDLTTVTGDIQSEIANAKETIDDLTGPIKRQN